MKQDDNKKFWDRVSKIYAPFMKSSDYVYKEISKKMTPYLHSFDRVLEIACGSGQLSFQNASKVKRWTATDFSNAMLDEAKKKNHMEKLFFEYQNAVCLTYEDESFDAVVIANALHIMPYPQKALSEIKRVLKKDGILIAPTFVHKESTGFRLRLFIMELAGFKVMHRWTSEEYVQFVSQQGFSVMEKTEMGSALAPLCCLIMRREDNK